MLCDICGKNPATVHLTEIINSQMNELHLCEECARQKSVEMEQQFGLGELLAGMAEFEKPAKEQLEQPALKCPQCGLALADFKKIGRLGCGECYNTFKKHLAPLLKRIHGSNQHVGKNPIKTTRALKKKIDQQELRERLKKAIVQEDFEEAARLRDQIREFEKKAAEETVEKKEQDEPK